MMKSYQYTKTALTSKDSTIKTSGRSVWFHLRLRIEQDKFICFVLFLSISVVFGKFMACNCTDVQCIWHYLKVPKFIYSVASGLCMGLLVFILTSALPEAKKRKTTINVVERELRYTIDELQLHLIYLSNSGNGIDITSEEWVECCMKQHASELSHPNQCIVIDKPYSDCVYSFIEEVYRSCSYLLEFHSVLYSDELDTIQQLRYSKKLEQVYSHKITTPKDNENSKLVENSSSDCMKLFHELQRIYNGFITFHEHFNYQL